MKHFLTLIFTFCFGSFVLATPADRIKIGPFGKEAGLQVKVISSKKRSRAATITIINAENEIVKSYNTVLVKGNNSLPFEDVTNLKEGLYTVTMCCGKKTLSTTFIIFQ